MGRRAISAADANRNFSAVLREVKAGASYVVTSHGRPVARIVPFRPGDRTGSVVRDALIARLRQAPAGPARRRWTRDEMHERGSSR